MIVNKCLANSLFKKCFKTVCAIQKANIYNRSRIGNREWVAFGSSGNASYWDDPGWPCPSIRFRESNNELLALREKEKGDWRKLTGDEKKILYRASYRQTLAEVTAPTGQWKIVMGLVLAGVSLGIWGFIFFKLFVYGPPTDQKGNSRMETLTDEWRSATLRKQLDLKLGHLRGVSSRWDYEKEDWKK